MSLRDGDEQYPKPRPSRANSIGAHYARIASGNADGWEKVEGPSIDRRLQMWRRGQFQCIDSSAREREFCNAQRHAASSELRVGTQAVRVSEVLVLPQGRKDGGASNHVRLSATTTSKLEIDDLNQHQYNSKIICDVRRKGLSKKL